MIKQQKILIITLACMFVILLVAYFAVIKPLTEEKETEHIPPETKDGEALTYNDYFLMFPQVEREEMQSIEVHNDYGTYAFDRSGTGAGDFVIRGFENLAYDQEKFSVLVVSTGYTMVPKKVTEHVTEQELIDYGFKGGEKEPAYYLLTTLDGTTHKVIIGKKIISGGGYYAMYEGRDTVYLLDDGIEEVLLVPVNTMVSPLLTAGIETTSYYLINNFTLKHYGDDFLKCRTLTSEELAEMETTAIAKSIAVFPAEYSLSTFYDQTLQAVCYYTGESVAALGLTDENLAEYGLKDSPYEISYDFNGYTYKLTASEPTDGYYYVATSLFNVIIKVPEADFKFLSWDLMKWIDPNVFSRNIKFVNHIDIASESFTETFRLYHYENEDPNLVVIGDGCGEIDDVRNFRELYKTLLLMAIEGYAPEDESIISDKNLILKFTATTNGGDVTEYAFYRYSTRRCLLTINGSGQFYVLVDTPEKIISDADKVSKGITVNAFDKN